MRTLFHILVGALGGFALGILGPVGLFALMSWMHPKAMAQGGGTPFAIIMIVTIPFGTAAGIVWGYFRANPIVGQPQEPIVGKPEKGSGAALAEVLQLATKLPENTQAKALGLWLTEWLGDFRAMMKMRLIWTAIFALLSIGSIGLMIFVLVAYTWQTAGIVMHARKQLQIVSDRWGSEVIDSLGPLPRSLRPVREMWTR